MSFLTASLRGSRMKKDRISSPIVLEEDFFIARKKMVKDQLLIRGITDERVLETMLSVPRHRFLDSGQWIRAYEDGPVNIGWGATISQPYIVAYMLEALQIHPDDSVLEIGTGCGYQAALLACLASRVYSIERVKELFFVARKHLKKMQFRNIILKWGDGTCGWKQFAPFSCIIVAASSPQIPTPLVEQLAEGGRLILPLGETGSQDLVLLTKENGEVRMKHLLACRFVKLKGKFGHRQD